MRAVFLDWNSVDNHDLDTGCFQLQGVEWEFYPNTTPETLHRHLAGAQIAVSNKVVLDEAALTSASELKLICVAATGTNNVDLAAASRRNIPVCNVRAYATPSVVQHVFMLILNLMRRLPDYRKALANDRWQQSEFFCLLDYSIEELTHKTIGIVGYGELGSAVAAVAKQFGMKVIVAQSLHGEPVEGRMPLAELLPNVDVLSLHCPLTAETENLITKHELALMKPSAILINTARGGIVDEAALLDALETGRLAGAGIDVLQEEPPIHGSALLKSNLTNLIVTPHIAWASRQARQRLIEGVTANIQAYLSGQIINQVKA